MSTETVAARMGAGVYAKPLEDTCIEYGIVTALQKSHFLGQVAHESDSFRTAREYASGAAYEGRKDLGNTQPGDGKRFRGRGLIQVTGRSNYLQCSLHFFGDDRLLRNPEILEQPEYAARCAGWYWQSRGLNKWADQDNLREITRRINGGYNGLADREKKTAQAKRLFDELLAQNTPAGAGARSWPIPPAPKPTPAMTSSNPIDSRSLEDLEPKTRALAKRFVEEAERAGFRVLVYSTFRNAAKQAQLYNQGRTAPGKVVTNARPGYSWHNFRRAFDFVPLTKTGAADWGNLSAYNTLGALGKSLGLTWGGDFKSLVDRPHFEYTGGLTLAKARAKYGNEAPKE